MINARVLLIDNEADFRDCFGDWLSFKGYEVETACDGIDGIEKLRTGSYDIILLDVIMPRMNGYEFCRVVNEDCLINDVPIVILSANYPSVAEFRNLGVAGFLQKMWDCHTILSKIEQVLASRRECQERPRLAS